jgi:hypothetical protein
MANDIAEAISANEIKNGTIVVTTTKTGQTSKIDTYVKNTPAITDIEDKYDERFDDPSYYYSCRWLI